MSRSASTSTSDLKAPRSQQGNGGITLDDKYRREEGAVLLSGIQALVRLPIDQHKADARRGLNTATLISGYRGSPLGGLDFAIQSNPKLMAENNIVFIPGVNEDLGATAIYGAQQANLYPNPKYDGVLGMWYGKAPGVDRTGDAFRHANFAGAGRNGGVLAVGGDDPECKSSTLPCRSEVSFYNVLMPVLFPGNIQEVLDYGRLGFELSRYTKLWVGFKVTTNVADGFATVEVSPDRVQPRIPEFKLNGRVWTPTQNPQLISSVSLGIEKEVYEGRLEAAREFGALNGLNTIPVSSPNDRIGLVAAGQTYYELREALKNVGLGSDNELRRQGIRLFKVGMLYPMDKRVVREFANGLDKIVVLEEKGAFLETFMRDLLYGISRPPVIIGKYDENGEGLVPAWSTLNATRITKVLATCIPGIPESLLERLNAKIEAPSKGGSLIVRQSFFCSGCPHNSSTKVPEGSVAGGGIGCHAMALRLDDRQTHGITHMGGEGAQFVGMQPFSGISHAFQNIGDGTFFHSGSLAVRQAVAAGTNITYKLLYNAAVAMTGGQQADGVQPVPEVTRMLEAEGVKRIIVTSDEPEKYPTNARWANNAEVWDRSRLDEAQRVLREIPGVTVLIHDQTCAAHLRRLRKRNKALDRAQRVWINERVCEGCGDCGIKSNCLSVVPIETEFGRKTQIHQSSCNKDYSCLQGDCPSFVVFEPKGGDVPEKKKTRNFRVDQAIPEPESRPREAVVYMAGIGGTGVVTINQILATAALIDGKHVAGLDQTGLSQKAGPVTSHLKISVEPTMGVPGVFPATTDCLLAFDLLTACTPEALSRLNPERTAAVVSTSKQATGSMVRSTSVKYPEVDSMLGLLESRTQPGRIVQLDAINLAETLFGDHMFANMISLGAAYQSGTLPVTASSVEAAIEVNGAAVAPNISAFRVGRLIVADPTWLSTQTPAETVAAKQTVAITVPASLAGAIAGIGASGEFRRLLEIRATDLVEYQNEAYARTYLDYVAKVSAAEERAVPGQTQLREAVARYLYKLMAYKDEYEVARLHLKSNVAMSEAARGRKVSYHYMLHPPILRAMGMKKKLKLGTWFNPAFSLLAATKFLRGTALDMFGYAKVRQVERQLIGEYRTIIDQETASLSRSNHGVAVELANLPDMIRGYEEIKLGNVELYHKKVAEVKAKATTSKEVSAAQPV